MNLVERVARMLDREGAYAECFDAATDQPKEPSVRQKYFQSVYELLSVDILKLCLTLTPTRIREQLVEFEKASWRRLGVPIDHPTIRDEAHKAIKAKY